MGKPLSMDLRARALAAVDSDIRSRRIEAQRAVIMAAFEEERDQSLEEPRACLAERGVAASTSALSRFFQRGGSGNLNRRDEWIFRATAA